MPLLELYRQILMHTCLNVQCAISWTRADKLWCWNKTIPLLQAIVPEFRVADTWIAMIHINECENESSAFQMTTSEAVLTKKVCDFIQHCATLSRSLVSLFLLSRTHISLTIHRVALSCRAMCNGKDKWRIKLRWQDWACMCVCAFVWTHMCVLHNRPANHLLISS